MVAGRPRSGKRRRSAQARGVSSIRAWRTPPAAACQPMRPFLPRSASLPSRLRASEAAFIVHADLIRAGRRTCDRHVEPELFRPRRPRRQPRRAAEKAARPSRGRRRRWPSGCRSSGPIGRPARTAARRRDRTRRRSPKARTASGVPRRSWPKAASGVMSRPASRVRDVIRWTNSSYSVERRAASKCWTTTTSTPASPSIRSRSAGSRRSGGAAPTRISSGWESNVMTDGRAPRSRASSTSRPSR